MSKRKNSDAAFKALMTLEGERTVSDLVTDF